MTALLTIVFFPCVGSKVSLSDGLPKTFRVQQQRLYERSLQDLIAIYLPLMVIIGESSILACFIYDPSMSLLLYSGLPATYQNSLTFWTCMVEEARYLTVFSGIAITALQLQVIAFDLVTKNVEETIEKLIKNR